MMAEGAQHLEGELTEAIQTEPTATAAYSEVVRLVDSSGMPIAVYKPGGTGLSGGVQYSLSSEERMERVVLSIALKEFERLNVKTAEVLAEAALAHERIGKDQQEIEELKKETRAMLTRLRAA